MALGDLFLRLYKFYVPILVYILHSFFWTISSFWASRNPFQSHYWLLFWILHFSLCIAYPMLLGWIRFFLVLTNDLVSTSKLLCIWLPLSLSQNVPKYPNHILPTHTKSIFILSVKFRWLVWIPNFISKNWFSYFFFIFWQAPISSSCRMPR